MSGIYIKDMEMPKERESFQITIKYNGLVFDTETGIQIAEAHEVTDHGRLIDADALSDMLEKYEHEYALEAGDKKDFGIMQKAFGLHDAELMAESLPTIIPADHAGKESV